MKFFKRNAVIVTVLLFVAVAVYLNWSYAQSETLPKTNLPKGENTETKDDTDKAEESGLYYVDGEKPVSGESGVVQQSAGTEASEYFDQVRLNRKQARDSAEAMLKTVTDTDGTAQETVDEAMSTMVQMAKWTDSEARLESLVVAKGFDDCVAYMTDSGVTVTVASAEEGLTGSGVAQIKDIVLDETEYTADQLKIIEIK